MYVCVVARERERGREITVCVPAGTDHGTAPDGLGGCPGAPARGAHSPKQASKQEEERGREREREREREGYWEGEDFPKLILDILGPYWYIGF